MAKKTKGHTRKAPVNELPDNMLPQNIVPVGERVEEDKNIYISQAVYKQIHKFTQNKTTNESGGMLVGTIIEEFGKTNIVISGFVEAKYCDATPTTLKFTHETWDYVHKEIEKKHSGKKIVGWIHTHPDFGIFLSEYDKFIHQNFFSEAYQIAYVVDPIQHIEGFYFWINGNIEKCKGFYIYDKTGTQITIGTEKEAPAPKAEAPLFSFKNILIAILSIAVVFLMFSNMSLSSKLEKIEKQQKTLTDSANQALASMQQLIWMQAAELQELKDTLTEAGIIFEPNHTDTPDVNTDTDKDNDTEDGTTDATTGENTDETTGSNPDTTGPADETTPDTTEGGTTNE